MAFVNCRSLNIKIARTLSFEAEKLKNREVVQLIEVFEWIETDSFGNHTVRIFFSVTLTGPSAIIDNPINIWILRILIEMHRISHKYYFFSAKIDAKWRTLINREVNELKQSFGNHTVRFFFNDVDRPAP